MSVCPVDEKGFCSRHETVHTGRQLEYALMDNDKGESFRRLWDEKLNNKKTQPAGPTTVERLAKFGKAFIQRKLSGSHNATDEQYAERIAICDQCPHVDKTKDHWECGLCGCHLKETSSWPGKARWASEKCDDGRWPVLPMVALDGGCNRCG